MRAFWALFLRDLLLVRRDRAGLLLLFLMPVVLVMVITLVQQNVRRAAGGPGARVVVVDQDHGGVGRGLAMEMQALGIAVVPAGEGADIRALKQECRRGRIQALVVVPAGFAAGLEEAVRDSLRGREGEKGARDKPGPVIKIDFDPAVFAGLRAAVTGAVRAAAARITARRTAAVLGRILPDRIRAALVAAAGPAAALAPVEVPSLASLGEEVVGIRAASASLSAPTAVQHNVPAWSLFGIFFISVPLAAMTLNERRRRIFARLLASPAPRFAVVCSRICAYGLVCFCQFVLLFAVGAWLLPLFGTDALVMPDAVSALLLTLVCACFAASGYGFLVGVVARTHEQAAMFASISVVVAAAVGGVMVPVYAMPPAMRSLSVVSPLAWGLDSLLALFVRGSGLAVVWPNLAALAGFGLFCLVLSWLRMTRGMN